MNEPTLVPCPDCGATGVAECPETGEDYPCPLCGGHRWVWRCACGHQWPGDHDPVCRECEATEGQMELPGTESGPVSTIPDEMLTDLIGIREHFGCDDLMEECVLSALRELRARREAEKATTGPSKDDPCDPGEGRR